VTESEQWRIQLKVYKNKFSLLWYRFLQRIILYRQLGKRPKGICFVFHSQSCSIEIIDNLKPRN